LGRNGWKRARDNFSIEHEKYNLLLLLGEFDVEQPKPDVVNAPFEMRVSVVIPVYNAGAFVREAVESALQQPETQEVVLVEDGSLDNSLEVCEALANEYEKVKFYRHPGGENRGAGATRNLGIEKSQYEYIAFLDADDYFLPNRFRIAKRMFANDPTLEGVYDPIQRMGISEASHQRLQNEFELQTTLRRVPPQVLFEHIIINRPFLLQGLIVKNNVFEKAGLFNMNLRRHQDVEWIRRLAATCRIAAGSIDTPVTILRIHDNNRVSGVVAPSRERLEHRLLLHEATLRWRKTLLPPSRSWLIVWRAVWVISRNPASWKSEGEKGLLMIRNIAQLVYRVPSFLVVDIFGGT